MTTHILNPGAFTFDTLRDIYAGPVSFSLDDEARGNIQKSRALVDERVASATVDYGITTGFGLLANTHIASDEVETLQKNLVLSHMAGVGEPLDDGTVRLVLALKAASLAQGFSGVRTDTVDALLALLGAGIYPVIPTKGSVGASGDLAPLAHMSGVLIGYGEVTVNGETLPAKEGLKRAGIEPLTLQAKEGLALLNGTQVSTALALKGLFEIEKIFSAALVSGAMSVDAMQGSDKPFDPRIQKLRRHPGQILVAKILLRLMDNSDIRASHEDCDHVQDPYSLRCQPQVVGAAADLMHQAGEVLLREANAVTDNPLIFADEGDVISGGNFHAEPVAFAADQLALALSELCSLCERRIALIVDPKMSGLPPFLTPEPGLNSGFMIAEVTAAALTSENKHRALSASIDSLPTSGNQEDHVSMATYAARRLGDMAENAANIVAIELLAAAQGLDFHAPKVTGPILQKAHAAIRAQVPTLEEDRPMAPDIDRIRVLVESGAFTEFAPDICAGYASA